MKKISIILIALLVLFVSVSCNMDSTTGLFQEAGTSAKKASYTIHNVLLRFSDSEYLVASDEGIFVFDGSKVGSSYGTGINSQHVVYATGTKDDWSCIYYDESAEKYYIIGNNTEKEEYKDLSSKYKNQGTYSYEYINSKDVKAQVFKNSEDGKYYIFYANDSSTLLKDAKLTSLSSYSYTSVTYMGDGLFICVEDGTSYYFASSDVNTRIANSNNYITHINGVFLNKSNTFYSSSASSISSISGNTYRRVATNLTDGRRYFMVRGLNYAYYVDSTNKLIETSVSGLSSIEVIFVAKVVNGNYINVITAQNGAQCINLVDKTVSSSWK